MLCIYVIIFLSWLVSTECAKILGIFCVASKSHHILGETLLKGLAAKGHEVTMLSPFQTVNTSENYKDISLAELFQQKNERSKMMLNMPNMSVLQKLTTTLIAMTVTDKAFYNHTKVKKLVNLKTKFDVAIISWFGDDALLLLAQQLSKYTIIFSPIGSHSLLNEITQNPAPPSYVPNLLPFSYPEEMNFIERVQNCAVSIVNLCFKYFNPWRERAVLKKLFSKISSNEKLYDHVSLVLLNTHYSLESTRPYVPQMVSIGGFHIEDPKPLSGDLARFMEEAEEGVILFSLGSNVKSSDLDKETRDGITDCFSKLPYKVLWKCESNNSSLLPQNVKVNDWLPQRDLLAHKNMKLFITQGGLLSTMEAVYNAVPFIGIPLFGDQEGNVNNGVMRGYALSIPPSDLSKDTLCSAIETVMNDSRFRNNIQARSKIMRDRPIKPLDKAVYWVEYVLRHKGAHHLKTRALKLRWYQLYLFDVLATVVISILVFFYIVRVIFQYYCKMRETHFIQNIKQKNR